MKLFATSTFALVIATFVAGPAAALPGYVASLPNGNAFSCANCHINGADGPRNAFGILAGQNKVAGAPLWSLLWNVDSDLDGYTNGQELGDPC